MIKHRILVSSEFSDQTSWHASFSRLDGAYSEGTLRAYRLDIKTFVEWCWRNEAQPFPASPETIAEFVTEQATRLSPSTIKRRLAAIGKIHSLMRFESPMQDEEVKLALRRIMRKRSQRPRQALGLNALLLKQIIEACPDNLIGSRNRAMISIGYDLLTRRSELVALKVEDLTLSQSNKPRALIRRSKNDPYGKGRFGYLSQRSYDFLLAWLREGKIKDGYIFRGTKAGNLTEKPLDPYSLNRTLKSLAKKAGMTQDIIKGLSGHSMRVGAAQDMVTSGIDILPIMTAGGWKSVNIVARYVEHADLCKLIEQSWK